MAVMEVLIHVKGDREAILAEMKRRKLPHKRIKFMGKFPIVYRGVVLGKDRKKREKIVGAGIWIENTHICLGEYGQYGNRLCLYSDSAKSDAGKPLNGRFGYGNKAIPFAAQVKIFNILKRAVIQRRAEFYSRTEKSMQRKRAKRDGELEGIHGVINFERGVLREEHQLEAQLKATIKFIAGLQNDFPKATFKSSKGEGMRVDNGILALHIEKLKQILAYLKAEEIETVHILKGASPVRVEGEGKRVRMQKKHLRKLSTELRKFAADLNYFLKVWVKMFQITTEMRAHLRNFYTHMFRVYSWYAELFKKESKK